MAARFLAALALAAALALPATAAAGAPRALTLDALLRAAPAIHLSDHDAHSAIRYNGRRWRGAPRAEILAWLRGKAGGDSDFTRGDVDRIARLQRGAGVPKNRIDGRLGNATVAVMLHAGMTLSAQSVHASHVELWFYPGSREDLDAWARARAGVDARAPGAYREVVEQAPSGGGVLYVAVDGRVVDMVPARGGPPYHLSSGTHTADPSKPGRYRLGRGKPYRTASWYYSQIPWGAALRMVDGEIQFRPDGAKHWQWATGPKSKLDYEIPRADFYDDDGGLMTEWRLNDFGAMAWRLNGSPGLLIHSTPGLEAGDEPLPPSHGCLHLSPDARRHLVSAGYLRRGVHVVIKRYRDHLLPRPMLARVRAGEGS